MEKGYVINGRNIRYYRNLKGISQNQLAIITGYSRVQISKLENGKVSNPSFDVIFRIASALGVTIEMLRTIDEGEDSNICQE